MNYKIVIPCVLMGVLFIVGTFFFISNNKEPTEDITESTIEGIAEQDAEYIKTELQKRKIIIDVNKKVVGECDSGIIKCDAKNGCKKQC